VVLALLITWLGLGVGYYSDYPVGFWITSVAFGVYLVAKGWQWFAGRARGGVVAGS
jgi:zinc/manganese transport system permease protein